MSFRTDQRVQLQYDLQNCLDELAVLSKGITPKLKEEVGIREGLNEHFEKGKQALLRINQTLREFGSTYSLFGCNSVLLLGIALATIFVLMII